MIDISKIDYSQLDRPELLAFLFHPRPEQGSPRLGVSTEELMIPVGLGVEIGARFHLAHKTAPNIIFFHGNGEIVADYDELGPAYREIQINFLPVDYRGYGRSSGNPSITSMMRDCHIAYDFIRRWLTDNGFSGPFVTMGRSLGSASALELVAHYGRDIDGLIIESGFGNAGPLLELLGLSLQRMGLTEDDGFRNIDKIRTFGKPTLIIHAEYDHIIPFSEGQALYDACPSSSKKLLKIPKANHNDIIFRGFKDYMAAIKALMGDITNSKGVV